ncbi:hypothetical protein TNCV_3357771 [Trichonephila clavipes]|nr:hypothetical protein TNCV_3357771 [Trichonephila clavipes]
MIYKDCGGSGPYVFLSQETDEDVDTTLLFPNSVTQGVCRNTYDGHRFCALARLSRLLSHTHSEKLLRVSLNALIHRRAAPTAHARTKILIPQWLTHSPYPLDDQWVPTSVVPKSRFECRGFKSSCRRVE